MARTRKYAGSALQARDALFAIEPEINNLDGLIAALRIFSEAQDSIEPIALSVLANAGAASLEEIRRTLHDGLETPGGMEKR